MRGAPAVVTAGHATDARATEAATDAGGVAPAVWLILEQHRGAVVPASLDLLADARRAAARLRGAVEAVQIGGHEPDLERLGAEGVAAVHLIDLAGGRVVEGGDLAPAAGALAALLAREAPGLVLAAATRFGEELSALLAARAGVALLPRCTKVDVDRRRRVQGQRPVYGGRASATVVARAGEPAIATIEPGAGTRASARVEQAATAQLRRVPGGWIDPAGFEVEERWLPGPWEMDLGEADVVVAGGRGLARAEDFELLARLAELLGGAVAASRPVVDARVAPYDRQVGLSGRTVTPRLYIACGISGAPHHVRGMRDAGAVIAINTDRHAPIFDLADVGIVDDARAVLPAVIDRITAAAPEKSGAPAEVAIAALRGAV